MTHILDTASVQTSRMKSEAPSFCCELRRRNTRIWIFIHLAVELVTVIGPFPLVRVSQIKLMSVIIHWFMPILCILRRPSSIGTVKVCYNSPKSRYGPSFGWSCQCLQTLQCQNLPKQHVMERWQQIFWCKLHSNLCINYSLGALTVGQIEWSS